MHPPFLGRPLPLPWRDFLSSSLLLGLLGGAGVPLRLSPVSLRESPRPESLDEVFLSRRLALALSRASWRLEEVVQVEEVSQLPLISFRFLLFSSSPDSKESLRSADSIGQCQNSPSASEKNK